jgi:hypothetical protein
MRNDYPGICYRCKKTVNAREGHFELIPWKERVEKKIFQKWRLQHAKCAIYFRGTKIGKEDIAI